MESLAPRPPETPRSIPVKDRRQAMDWSLVLASQGIAATLEHDRETDRWSLAVDGPDRERALASLKRYHTENKGWHWEQPVHWAGLVFHWGGLIWCGCLAMIHALVANGAVRLRDQGIMDGARFRDGEWWRIFTAETLHGDSGHLVSNVVSGFLLFGLAMARYGPGMGLLAAWFAGATGFLIGPWIYPDTYRALGASGMVTGALGLLAAESLRHWRASPVGARRAQIALGGGAMLFLLIGSDPGSDLVAHLGGFVAGCVCGALLGGLSRTTLERPAVRNTALSVFVGGVLVTWMVALWH